MCYQNIRNGRDAPLQLRNTVVIKVVLVVGIHHNHNLPEHTGDVEEQARRNRNAVVS